MKIFSSNPFVNIRGPLLHIACYGPWNRSLPTPPVVNLKTSSPQISVLLSPAQLLKVGPRRKCRRKAAPAICWVWIWPVSDHAGHVQVSLFFLSCGVLSRCSRNLCFHSWASCLNVRGIEADLAVQNCTACFLLWPLLAIRETPLKCKHQ